MHFRSGQLERGYVIGGYRIDELIKRGGMGAVYRATNLALNRIYALKVIAPELADDDQFRNRFKREMRIAASLHDQHVVGIHYAGEQEGLLFLVMDFVYGTDLRELVLKHGALEAEQAVDLLAQVGSALDAAHHKGLVHRDVKPGNILVTVRDGEEHAYLTDFGLAKRSDTLGALTQAGAVVGTVDYMAPEQVTGGSTDARTDIYALGCVFFQMLTGNVPYERENSVATLFAHVHEPPPPVEARATETYPALNAVVEKAMAKEPADRYPSAGDFVRDAAAALRGTRYTGAPSVVATGEAKPADETVTPASAGAAEAKIDRAADPEPPAWPAEEPQPSPSWEARTSRRLEPDDPPSPEPAGRPSPEPAGRPSPDHEARPSPDPGAAASADSIPAPRSQGAASTTSGASQTPPAGPPQGPPTGPPREPGSHPPGGGARKYRWPALAALLVIAAGVVAVVVGTSGSSRKSAQTSVSSTSAKTSGTGKASGAPAGLNLAATAAPVPTNRVTGHGTASVLLNGDTATVKVTTVGLLDGSPHLMHIHAGGLGLCPPASAARLHNGHLAISTGNGIKFYGPPMVSLTLRGDTSAKSNVAFPRYPSVGAVTYERVIKVPSAVATLIHAGNAVVVIHGIDYDNSGTYDEVLGPSDLAPQFTGDSTAPALCGHLIASRTNASTRPAQSRSAPGQSSPAPIASAPTSQPTVYTASLSRTSLADSGQAELALLCHLAGLAAGSLGVSPTSGLT